MSSRSWPLVLCFAVSWLPFNAQAQTHFTACVSPNIFSATIIIPASINPTIEDLPFEVGDEVAVFSAGDLCAGMVVWNGNNTALSIFADDPLTPELDGLLEGEEMLFRIWEASSGVEHAADVITVAYAPTSTQTDGMFAADAIYVLSTLFVTGSLPVELVSFEATRNGNTVALTWETASETNNAGFEIQRRSTTGEEPAAADWHVIGFVEGQGTTLEPHHYSYRTDALTPGRHRFRLKQIDFDGSFEYSPEVEVFRELPEAFWLSPPYPNPFNPEARFSLMVKRRQAVDVSVYDVQARRVRTLYQGDMVAEQARAFVFEAADLPSGLYLIRATGEAFITTRRVMLVK